MSQHDLVIANADGATVRADINSALAALGSLASGATAPATTYAYMFWADTATGLLKQRNAANTGWLVRGTLAESFVETKTANFTVGLADHGKTFLVSASSGDVTVTLAAAATLADGFRFAVAKTDSSANAVTIDANGSETIDGALTRVLRYQHQAVTLACNGAAFRVIATAGAGLGRIGRWIDAAQIRPTVTSGCAARASAETTAGRPDISYIAFDGASAEYGQFTEYLPEGWDGGPVTFLGVWSTSATDTDGIALALQAVACADGDTADVAFGTAVVVTDDAQGAAEDILLTPESADVTIAGSPAAGELATFQVYRDVADGNDDMTEDLQLIGIWLFFGYSAETDD